MIEGDQIHITFCDTMKGRQWFLIIEKEQHEISIEGMEKLYKDLETHRYCDWKIPF